MTFSQWLLVLGTLLLVLALASAYLRLLPVSSSVLYLLFGLGVGPIGLGLWQLLDRAPRKQAYLAQLARQCVL